MEPFILIRGKEKNQRFFCPSFFPKTRKGQVWGLDLIIAVIIFLAGIVVLYLYSVNYLSQSNDDLENLFYEGNVASELILNDENVGIISDFKVNQSKLDVFSLNYDMKKKDIGIVHDFYFSLEDSYGSSGYFGKLNTTAVENIIQITRITIYHNRPVKFLLNVYG